MPDSISLRPSAHPPPAHRLMIPTVEVFVGATALALHRSSTISLLIYWNVRLVFHIRFFRGQMG